MSYLDQAQDPRHRLTALATVAAAHAGMGALLIVGLTISGVIQVEEKPFGGVTYTEPQPLPTPQPPEPEPSEAAMAQAPVPTAPLPPIQIAPADPAYQPLDLNMPILPDVRPLPYPPATPGPAPTAQPSPAITPRAAAPANSPGGWIGNDDYPARELRGGVEGSVSYRLTIGANGRVERCDIASSSGNRGPDDATCRLITRRARFEPATDASGATATGSFTGSVRWQIPD